MAELENVIGALKGELGIEIQAAAPAAQEEPAEAFSEKKLKIELGNDHEKFDGTLVTMLTTTDELGTKVNDLFSPVLHDFSGSVIGFEANGSISLTLFFTDKGKVAEGKIKNLSAPSVGPGADNSLINRVTNMNNLNLARPQYSLTKETKDVLSEFVRIKDAKGNINWNNICSETSNPTAMGYQILYCVKVDLIYVLKKIYGAKVDDVRVDYQINVVRPISGGNGAVTNYMVTVLQLDTNHVADICKKVGMIPQYASGVYFVKA